MSTTSIDSLMSCLLAIIKRGFPRIWLWFIVLCKTSRISSNGACNVQSITYITPYAFQREKNISEKIIIFIRNFDFIIFDNEWQTITLNKFLFNVCASVFHRTLFDCSYIAEIMWPNAAHWIWSTYFQKFNSMIFYVNVEHTDTFRGCEV